MWLSVRRTGSSAFEGACEGTKDGSVKPRILVALLCGLDRTGWINPDLALMLITMGRDARFECDFAKILDARPHEFARNIALATARDGNYSWLCSLDNDNCPTISPLDVIAAAPADCDVCGVRYAIREGRDGAKFFPEAEPTAPYSEVREVAGGVLMIRNSVWKKVPRGPWFSWQFLPGSETLETAMGEDVWFSAFVRSKGLKIYCHQTPAGHLKVLDVTAIAQKAAKAAER